MGRGALCAYVVCASPVYHRAVGDAMVTSTLCERFASELREVYHERVPLFFHEVYFVVRDNVDVAR